MKFVSFSFLPVIVHDLVPSENVSCGRHHYCCFLNFIGMFFSTMFCCCSRNTRSASSSIISCFLKCSMSSGCIKSSSFVFSSWYLSKWWISYSYSSSPWWPGPSPESGSFLPARTPLSHWSRVITPLLAVSKILKALRTALSLTSAAVDLRDSSSSPYVRRTSSGVQTPSLLKS